MYRERERETEREREREREKERKEEKERARARRKSYGGILDKNGPRVRTFLSHARVALEKVYPRGTT